MMSLNILRAQIGRLGSRICMESFSTTRNLNRAKLVRPKPKAPLTTPAQTQAPASSPSSSSSSAARVASPSSPPSSEAALSGRGSGSKPTGRASKSDTKPAERSSKHKDSTVPPARITSRSTPKSSPKADSKVAQATQAVNVNNGSEKKSNIKSNNESKVVEVPGKLSETMRTPRRKFIKGKHTAGQSSTVAARIRRDDMMDDTDSGSSRRMGSDSRSEIRNESPKQRDERQNMFLRKRTLDVLKPLTAPVQHIKKYEDDSEHTEISDTLRNRKQVVKTKEPSNRPKGKITFSRKKSEEDEMEKNRPFTLPSGTFKPKQSLGQNFLSDQNYVNKIVEAFKDDSNKGNNVVEIGPGPGALTRVLYPKYPNMTAIEIDGRAVEFLHEKLPGLNVQHLDVLKADWPQLAADKGGCLNIIANLPYYIVSQVLFSLADSHRAVDTAVLTMQLEVALRITAKPSTKDYGIPSVVFQLYGAPVMNFLIPPSVFYPKPKVDSALLTLDFRKPNPDLYRVDGDHLRRVLTASFQQRRKMLRHSLKDLLLREGFTLDEKWATRRPEQLTPSEFIQMTAELFGENPQPERTLPADIAVVTEVTKKTEKKNEKKEQNERKVKEEKKVKEERIQQLRRKKMNAEQIAAAAHTALLDASLLLAKEKEEADQVVAAAIATAEKIEKYNIARRERDTYVTRPVWRMALFGASGTRGFGMNQEEEVIEKERMEKKKTLREEKKRIQEADERFLMGYDD